MRGRSRRASAATRAVAVAALTVAPIVVGVGPNERPGRADAAPFPAQIAPAPGDAANCDVVVLGGTCSLGPTADGSPYTWTIPAGLTRVLAVVRGASGSTGDLFGAPAVAGGQTAPATAGIAVVLGRSTSGTVTVTNAFVAPSAPTTTAAGGGGRLPSTGPSFGPILVIAGAALALGLAVSPLARRRRGGLDG